MLKVNNKIINNIIINFKCLFCEMPDISIMKIHYGNIITNKDGTLYIENLRSKCITCDELIIK